MRALHKAWSNTRPGQRLPWSRRVRWYQGKDDVRLQFDERTPEGRTKDEMIFADRDEAQRIYDLYAGGGFSVADVPSMKEDIFG